MQDVTVIMAWQCAFIAIAQGQKAVFSWCSLTCSLVNMEDFWGHLVRGGNDQCKPCPCDVFPDPCPVRTVDKASFICAVSITVNVAFIYIRMFNGVRFVMVAVDYLVVYFLWKWAWDLMKWWLKPFWFKTVVLLKFKTECCLVKWNWCQTWNYSDLKRVSVQNTSSGWWLRRPWTHPVVWGTHRRVLRSVEGVM